MKLQYTMANIERLTEGTKLSMNSKDLEFYDFLPKQFIKAQINKTSFYSFQIIYFNRTINVGD